MEEEDHYYMDKIYIGQLSPWERDGCVRVCGALFDLQPAQSASPASDHHDMTSKVVETAVQNSWLPTSKVRLSNKRIRSIPVKGFSSQEIVPHAPNHHLSCLLFSQCSLYHLTDFCT